MRGRPRHSAQDDIDNVVWGEAVVRWPSMLPLRMMVVRERYWLVLRIGPQWGPLGEGAPYK